MDVNRFKSIIEYSRVNLDEIEVKIRKFCAVMNIRSDSDVRDVLLLVREVFLRRGFIVFEMPFMDDEIGALCYKGDGLGYVVINSSLPRVNNNFAVAHEIYHVFFQENEFKSKIEFANEYYYESEDEHAANIFAGALLMPENSFRGMFDKFRGESQGISDTICKLMNYYQTPYMATLIRCCELQLINMKEMSGELMFVNKEDVFEKFDELWLDKSIFQPSCRDDFPNVERLVGNIGKEYIEGGYINQRTFDMVITNIRILSKRIRGKE